MRLIGENVRRLHYKPVELVKKFHGIRKRQNFELSVGGDGEIAMTTRSYNYSKFQDNNFNSYLNNCDRRKDPESQI